MKVPVTLRETAVPADCVDVYKRQIWYWGGGLSGRPVNRPGIILLQPGYNNCYHNTGNPGVGNAMPCKMCIRDRAKRIRIGMAEQEPGYTVRQSLRVRLTVKGSRFIASLAPANTEQEALHFISSIQAEFPDATHHTYACLLYTSILRSCVRGGRRNVGG